jgi:hypothetical protein
LLLWFSSIRLRSGSVVSLAAGLPADREVTDLPPVLVVTDAPAAHQVEVQHAEDRGQERRQREGVGAAIVREQALSSPLHRQRAQAAGAAASLRRRIGGRDGARDLAHVPRRVVEPQGSRVARERLGALRFGARVGPQVGRCSAARPDQQVRDVVVAALRFVAEEERLDLAFGRPR